MKVVTIPIPSFMVQEVSSQLCLMILSTKNHNDLLQHTEKSLTHYERAPWRLPDDLTPFPAKPAL